MAVTRLPAHCLSICKSCIVLAPGPFPGLHGDSDALKSLNRWKLLLALTDRNDSGTEA